MTVILSSDRIAQCYSAVRSALLGLRNEQGHWSGELSASPLSTATAVMALEMVRRDRQGEPGLDERLSGLIDRGLTWLADTQNDDGGWGDTVKSLSNISTTMLARAVFHAADADDDYHPAIDAATGYIHRVGGVSAVLERYGRDRTFSIPILTHCALAGLCEWRDVLPLPFELACLPPQFYKTVRLPVVSYALPALIAIGQVRHHHRKPWNPVTWAMRSLSVRPALKRLEHIQPENGGFLEAVPLTSFVTMSLAGMGLSRHPVARRGLDFILDSALPDGSWRIDTNLATWVTTLSVNALEDDLPDEARPAIRDWLLGQQYREIHPYTSADPGGWAWTDLPGGVPDADDTPGAILALLRLRRAERPEDVPDDEHRALACGVEWLVNLQNRDRGWPTFCRGWGKLPFDRSAPDLTAHAIRALLAWLNHPASRGGEKGLRHRAERAALAGFEYLAGAQREDGSWLPLWFGNQFAPDDENPTYGTARVLAAYRDAGLLETEQARLGLQWLEHAQDPDGGWGGAPGIIASVEETALAVEAMLAAAPESDSARRGVAWLINCVEQGTFQEPSPIGFYFAKLWYFEKMYPVVFITGALRRACRTDF